MRDLPDFFPADATQAVVAGAAGGLVRWLTLRDDWRSGSAALIVGALCAVYLGPLVYPVLEPAIGKIAPGAGAQSFGAFVVGLGGISISGLVIDIIRIRRRSIAGEGKPDDKE